jgi:hypothetical protein
MATHENVRIVFHTLSQKTAFPLVIWVIALVLFATCHHCTNEWERRMHYQPMEIPELAPHAVGRYVIGFPKGVILLNWCQTLRGLGKIKITRNVSQSEWEQKVKIRANHFQSIPHNRGGTQFEKIVELNIPYSASVLYWPDDISPKGNDLWCETYYLKENVLFEVRIYVDVVPKDQENDLHRLEDTLRSIRFLQPNEIPKEPGACFDGAMLMDAPERLYSEMVGASILWPDRPDVRFEFLVSDNGDRPDPPLLTRLKRANAIPLLGVLRSRARVVGGIPGEEHLERVTESNGTVSHLFIWEAQGLPNRFDHPQIRLDMSTGHGKDAPIHSTLSDEDALKLWDAVLDSLHWRPTEPPTQAGPRTLPGRQS